MTKVFCNYTNCAYNCHSECTKESLSINRMSEPTVMSCQDCPAMPNEPTCDDWEVYNAAAKMKSICLDHSSCKNCPLYDESGKACGVKDMPGGWMLKKPSETWRVFR